MDRALVYGTRGWGFESLPVHMAMDFKRVHKTGYSVADVDAFFESARSRWDDKVHPITEREVRFSNFRGERGGYSPYEVDVAIDTLEQSLSHKKKAEIVSQYGQDHWFMYLKDTIDNLGKILTAPKKSRFPLGEKSGRAYHKKEVDKYLKVLNKELAQGARGKLSTQKVLAKKFHTVSGHKGYKMQAVDEYIDDVITALNALRG